ncbi:MAG: lactate dehydrogenase/glycoside hydrolase [Piptocephalis tieghemiana]|nr:MAG: lactate dehydrogenase/glycoside hydrolase [Piptocephalis tieghemiana]
MSHKVAIIGAGQVGASIAYAMVLRKLTATIYMTDKSEKMCKGQVLDISDATFFSPTKVREGTYQECGQCDVIIITAGAKQLPGEPRSQLVDRNHAILTNIIHDMQPIQPNAVLILVANPVDVLTHIALKLSGLPPKQVLGSGTFLDSMRLRHELSNHFHLSPGSIHAYVMGEHGDNQFVHWSSVRIAGVKLEDLPEYTTLDKEAMALRVKRKAYEIIDLKGATHFGVGTCVASMARSILYDKHDIVCVSVYVESEDSVVSIPSVLGAGGIQQIIPPVDLDESETLALKHAVNSIREACKDY